jgi:superfamily II DNA or RNA helicase
MPRAIDRLIAESPDWGAFWRRLVQESPAKQGAAFERLTQLYLLSQPEYRTQLKAVWRLDEVPPATARRLKLPRTDEGIDLVAETHSGKRWAIQCKFRSDSKSSLTYRELSTFTSLTFVTCKGFDLAVVAHTCSKPVRKRALLGNTTEIGLDRWLSLAPDEWAAIQSLIAGRAIRLKPRSPRPHQRAAIDAAVAHYKSETRGRLIMPCGTGKSLTAFWIAQALGSQTTLVAVPSLALIRQSLQDWTREYLAAGEVPDWLVVCSDETTGKLDQDEFVGETYDLGIPATTKSAEIIAFLKARSRRRIVFTTYQSSAVVALAAKKAKVSFDLAVLDEAHKTVGSKSKSFATLLSDDNVAARARVFMTATERVLRGKNDDVFSMDDETVYGRRFHQLTFKDAIASGIISDYQILTITINDQSIRDLVAENRFIYIKGDEVEAQALAAGIALRRAFEKHGITHAISFHRSIKAASEFSDRQAILDHVVQPKLSSLHVSSKKTTGERAELLREFVAEKRALMTNARCLTEGVDVPAIDCVLFADPKQSVVDIVQAAGRALRPYPGKQRGYIVLPLIVPTGMELKPFAETTAFKQVARTVAALSTQDERIVEQFRVAGAGRTPSAQLVEVEGDVPVGVSFGVDVFAAQIGTRIWERVGKVNWRPFAEAREFSRTLNLKSQAEWIEYCKSEHRPRDIPTNPNVVYQSNGWKNLGDWLGTEFVALYLRNYRPFSEARDYVRNLKLKSVTEWRAFCKTGLLPPDIPLAPQMTYKGKGWSGVSDWLGSGKVAPGGFRPFLEARQFVRSLGLRSRTEWEAKVGTLPPDIPKVPSQAYRKDGWTGWGDWLGTGTVQTSQRTYRTFVDAREFVHDLKLKSWKEWRAACRERRLPRDIPSDPKRVYELAGWISTGDWLGTQYVANYYRKFLPFEQARGFARKLKLQSESEWRAYCKSGRRPSDIPSNPGKAYRNSGWLGWGNWLGTNNTRSPSGSTH